MELAVDPLERDDADFWGPLMTVAGRCLGTLMHSELRSSSMASLTRLQVPGTVNVQSGETCQCTVLIAWLFSLTT